MSPRGVWLKESLVPLPPPDEILDRLALDDTVFVRHGGRESNPRGAAPGGHGRPESEWRVKTIVVHGLGYVGLTAAVHYAQAGWRVFGYDPDVKTVDAIYSDRPRGGEFLGRYLGEPVAQLVREGRLSATTSLAQVMGMQTHVLAVPTERDGKPHDAIVLGALKQLLVDRFGPPLTVLVESTLTPGTVDRFMAAHPAAKEAVGLGAVLAVCPRRDWFADPEKNLATLARVVGGVTPRCTRRAAEVVGTVSREVLTTDYRTAELTKALENALFHVPVAFLHQLAYALPDHNVAEAARLAATHWRLASFGSLYLGFGTGGRCLDGDETVVAWDGREARIVAIREFVANWHPGLAVLSRRDDGRTEFRRVLRVGVREAETVELETQGNHRLTVSPDHQMYVTRVVRRRRSMIDGRQRELARLEELVIPARDLAVGDVATFIGDLPTMFDRFVFDLLDAAGGGDVLRRGGDEFVVCGREPTGREWPRRLPLDEELAELLGLIAAEGWVSVEARRARVGIAFDAADEAGLARARWLLKRLGVAPEPQRTRRWRTVALTVSSWAFAGLVEREVGTNSYDAKVPTAVLLGQPEWRHGFLRGALMGDGSVTKHGALEFYSASRELAEGVQLLLRSFGLSPTLKRTVWRIAAMKYVVTVAGERARTVLKEILVGAKRERLTVARRPNRWGTTASAKAQAPKIRAMRPSEARRVYSLDVEGTANFVATGGWLVHNCVPLGTEYLVSAARARGIGALDAILGALTIGEAALQWDEEFRRVVAVAAVGDGRPTVLVLGVAYRPDFKDAGRSPGLGVARHLKKLGAKVSVADPMWTPVQLEQVTGLPVWEPGDGLRHFDVVLLATPHGAYRDLPLDPGWRGGQMVLDGQGAWADYRAIFEARGVAYRRVGEPGWLGAKRQ